MAAGRRFQFVSDTDLVQIARLGSPEACDELVRRFRGAVLLTAEQVLGSREAAQDVAQEAFLAAFRALPRLQDPAKFAGWLYAITRNRARRVAQGNRRSEPTEADRLEHLLTTQSGPTPSPLEQLLRDETQDHVRALMAELPPEIQIVLHLYYYQDWPAGRIADFLMLPLTTIKGRLYNGRNRIRRRFAHLIEEKSDVRTPSQKERNTSSVYPVAQDGRNGRTHRADRQLRKRHPQQLRQTLQCDCGTS
jgi:RNA polymerase sigma-70 factor (ECF subfamily)